MKHEQGRRRRGSRRGAAPALPTGALLLPLLTPVACASVQAGRSAVDSVRVVNARALTNNELVTELATQPSPKFFFLFQGVVYDYTFYDEAVVQRDMARIEWVYRSKGFFDAHARVARVRQVSRNHVAVEIVVQEGKPTFNRSVTVAGVESIGADASRAVLAAAARLTRGERFDEARLTATKIAVKRALTDRAYAYATVQTDAEVDIGQHAVDYRFEVVAGPLTTFGPVTIVDRGRASELPEEPLRRAIDIREGTPYSTAKIESATQALLNLGVFSAVQIAPLPPGVPRPDAVVPLRVDVQPIQLREVTVGGGVEADAIKTDVHLVAGWQDHNFAGGLRDFAVTFKPGLVIYPIRIDDFSGTVRPLPEERLRMTLRQPGFIEARTTAFVRPEFNVFPLLVQVDPLPHVPVVGYIEAKAPIGLERTFWNKLYVAVDYTFQLESPFAYVGDIDPALESLVLSFAEVVARLDLRDDQVRPHSGVYVGATVQMAGGVFGGTASDVRVQPELRTYLPIAPGLTWASRASLGFLWASNYGRNWNEALESSGATSVASAPSGTPQASARAALEHDIQIMYFRGLFSGGPATNRGFPLLGVSPHGVVPFLNPATASQQEQLGCDPGSANFASRTGSCFLPVGGFTLWELENEVRADISGPLSGTAFCDMSDVSPREMDIRPSHLHLSCGLGIAYDTPVGPVRADLAYRVQPLQVLGYRSETAAAAADPVNGTQPTIFGFPLSVVVGIGEAF